MKKLFLPIAIITTLSIASCGGDSRTDSTDKTTSNSTEQTCFYSYDANAGAQVKWTAFKTTKKVPVAGQFNEVNVTGGEKSTKITDVLETIMFNIPTSSTNTTNPKRDAKIINSFFGSMDATDIIFGKVKSAQGDNTSGTCTFYITLNNIEKEVIFNYKLTDATIKLTGEINLLDFSGEDAIESLNKVCLEKHTGEDGVSKTWPNVEIEIETTLKKACH